MIKILHSADWHLDSPLVSRDPALRHALGDIPGKIAALCKKEACDVMLLSGDLFDSTYSPDTVQALKRTLRSLNIPVFITPGNHDFAGMDSPWIKEVWPENVHVFTRPVMEAIVLEELDLVVYGAGYTAMECPGLLDGFTARGSQRYKVGLLHGDATQVNSTYCPVTRQQVLNSGLDYLALGHIHKADAIKAGKTLCAWPGCPMGRGYDEPGRKGVLIITLEDTASALFMPLEVPRFFDLEVFPGDDPAAALNDLLPAAGSADFYRVTFTGPSKPLDLKKLLRPDFPNLTLVDETVPPLDLWGSADQDTFEGRFFKLLQDQLAEANEEEKSRILLAAELSRRILDGQEVVLP